MALEILILAAGLGKRMRSGLPKVLHPLAGRPLLAHVLDTARELSPRKIIVVHGHGAASRCSRRFRKRTSSGCCRPSSSARRMPVMQAMPRVSAGRRSAHALRRRAARARGDAQAPARGAGDGLAVLTAEPEDPAAYGRVVRDVAGRVKRVVELRDASPAEREIREINAGFYALSAKRLAAWLKKDRQPQRAEGVLPHRSGRAGGRRRRAGRRGEGR